MSGSVEDAHCSPITAFDGTTYAYDPNGSMLRKGPHSIRYDAERRPARVSEGASVLWRASYDGDGARRKRLDGKGTIHYLPGYERNVGNGQETAEVVTKYYRALGRLVAVRRNGSLYWVGTDHLGGTVRVASSSFEPVAGMRYMPYGLSRDSTDDPITDYLFTSQQLDASIGLYWYGSRAYDQSLGRFTCADSLVQTADNPQALNRYSYVANNPMGRIDSSGHVWEDWDGSGGWSDGGGEAMPAEGSYDWYSGGYSEGSSADVGTDWGGYAPVEDTYGGAGMGDVYASEGAWSPSASDAQEFGPSYEQPAAPSYLGAVESGGEIAPCLVQPQSITPVRTRDIVDYIFAHPSGAAQSAYAVMPLATSPAGWKDPAAPDIAMGVAAAAEAIGLTKPDTVASRVFDAATARESPRTPSDFARGATSGGIANGLIQGVVDSRDPGLSDQQRAERFGIATGMGATGAAASGWAAASRGVGGGGAVAVALIVGTVFDTLKEWIFDARGLQPRR